MGASVLVGVMNGVVVVVGKIDSLIGTLATGFLVQAMVKWRTGSRNVSGVELSRLVHEHRSEGVRRPHPAGLLRPHPGHDHLVHPRTHGDRPADLRHGLQQGGHAAGVGAHRAPAVRLASSCPPRWPASPASCWPRTSALDRRRAGTTYLLPAFAAVFLGATQLKHGRFNAWGTIIAVLILGTGTTGLGLAKVDQWVQDVFTGVVLIAALALTGFEVRRAGSESRRARSKRRSAVTADGQVPPSTTVGTSACHRLNQGGAPEPCTNRHDGDGAALACWQPSS